MILKMFSPKKWRKNWRFLPQSTVCLCKNVLIRYIVFF
jgi:hypothetical protein